MAPETVVELTGCAVNSRGTVLSPDGVVLWGVDSGFGLQNKRGLARVEIGPAIPGKWVHGLHRDQHFGHWLLHRIPRIVSGVRHSGQSAILTGSASWDSGPIFESLGTSPESVKYLPWDDPSTFFPVESLVVANDAAPPSLERGVDCRRFLEISKSMISWARHNSNIRGHEAIYLSRTPHSGLRQGCVNREVIEEVVRRKGIPIIYPGNLGLADQIVLVSQAQLIISEYGSESILSLFAEEMKSLVLLTPRHNYEIEHGIARRAPWSRSIVLARGGEFRHARVSTDNVVRSWRANPEMVHRVLAHL